MSNNSVLKPTTNPFHVRRTLLRSIVGRKHPKNTKEVDAAVAPATQTVQGLAAALEHEEIAHKAWKLWKEEGCPEGKAENHWFRAQQILRKEQEE